MNSLMFLIPIALAMGAAGLVIFFWAMRHDQFEDLDGAANRILIDDEDLSNIKPASPKAPKDGAQASKQEEDTSD